MKDKIIDECLLLLSSYGFYGIDKRSILIDPFYSVLFKIVLDSLRLHYDSKDIDIIIKEINLNTHVKVVDTTE